ncbi:hypothetical protein Pelo_10427 [Pelomyxa schiedti]|nr:hypothetical protein Pelo_10427 [Pelomyxa schiedti]
MIHRVTLRSPVDRFLVLVPQLSAALGEGFEVGGSDKPALAVVFVLRQQDQPGWAESVFSYGREMSRRLPGSVLHLHDGPVPPTLCPFPNCNCDVGSCAAACRALLATNAAGLDIKPGTYGSLNLRPRLCDAPFLESALIYALATHKCGAVYVWVPVNSPTCSPYLEAAVRHGLKPWVATDTYLIYYKWNAPGKDMVPSAASSISGAQIVLISPDKTHVLMTLEERVNDPAAVEHDSRNPPKITIWRFPGGAIDPGESNVEGLIRELHEEIGVSVPPSAVHLVKTINISKARAWGVFDPADKPLLINDHLQIFTGFLDPTLPLTPEAAEIKDVKWLPIASVMSGKVSNLNRRHIERLKEALGFISLNNINP